MKNFLALGVMFFISIYPIIEVNALPKKGISFEFGKYIGNFSQEGAEKKSVKISNGYYAQASFGLLARETTNVYIMLQYMKLNVDLHLQSLLSNAKLHYLIAGFGTYLEFITKVEYLSLCCDISIGVSRLLTSSLAKSLEDTNQKDLVQYLNKYSVSGKGLVGLSFNYNNFKVALMGGICNIPSPLSRLGWRSHSRPFIISVKCWGIF